VPAPGTPALPRIPGYTLLERIGAGAMGEVFRATHRATAQEVALKLISRSLLDSAEYSKRFQREIELLMQLDHPNIAKAIDSGIHDGRLYLAMEYVRGPTLGSLLKMRGAFHEADVLRLTIQICQALDNVHTKFGLIHRDIKPANILIVPGAGSTSSGGDSGDLCKIIDFGLARSTHGEDQSLTITGMVMGTPFYMSPEQIRGEKDLSIHTDIYAIGASMFHLLTGALPFDGSSPAIVMTGHLHGKVPDPGRLVPSLSNATRQIVMTAMAKDPKKRFLNYPAVMRACESALTAVAGKDTTAVKLLRKPMTLKVNPKLRQATAGSPPPDGVTPTPAGGAPLIGGSDGSVVDPFGHELSNRIRRNEKGSEKPTARVSSLVARAAAVDDLIDDSVLAVGVAPTATTKPTTRVSAALRLMQSDKIRRIQTTMRIRRFASEKQKQDSSGAQLVDSLVVSEEVEHAHAHSLLVPVLLIALPLVCLVGYLVYRSIG